MAGNTVSLTQSIDDREVVKAFQKQTKLMDGMLRRMDQLGNKGQRTGRKTKEGFAGALSTLKEFGGAITGIGSIVGGVAAAASQMRRELDNIREKQAGAAGEQIAFQDALSQAVRNATGVFTADEVRKLSIQLSTETGVTPTKAASVIGSAVTSTGVENKADAQQAIAAARAALKFAPELEASGVEAIGGVSASLAKRFQVSPEAAIGFIQNVGGKANIRELEPLINNLAPVVANLTQFGLSPQESGALSAVLTQGTGDVTGELSGTAAVNLARSIEERFPGQRPGAVIRQLQQDDELRKRFFEGGEFAGKKFGEPALGKGKAIPTIRAILTEGTLEAGQFSSFQRDIGGFDQGQKTFDEVSGGVASVTRTARLKRAFETAESQIQIGDPTAIGAVTREGFQKLLKASGASALEQSALTGQFELLTKGGQFGSVEEASSALRNRASRLTAPTTKRVVSADFDAPPQTIDVPREVSPEDRRIASLLTRMAKSLDVLAEETKKPRDVAVKQDVRQVPRKPAAQLLDRRN